MIIRMSHRTRNVTLGALITLIVLLCGVYLVSALHIGAVTYSTEREVKKEQEIATTSNPDIVAEAPDPSWPLTLDTKEYDRRLLILSDYKPEAPIVHASSSTSTATTTTPASKLVYSDTANVTITGKRWPTAQPYPHGDAILPFKRIVAYYGNLYSTKMGVLGEYEPDDMLERLRKACAEWETADPSTPVLPAIEYIAIVAQGAPGADGMYRAVMPDTEIEKAYTLAHKSGGIFILDLQTGLSTIQKELPKFKKYLEHPDVHLAIDPEFSMKTGKKPGTVIGTYDASDVNYVINYLADIVEANKLPPKVLIVHRFTEDMVTGSNRIAPTPEVQVVINMDGWGSKDLKTGTYTHIIEPEPVQFTGVKLFYKNDLKPPSTRLLTPQEVLLFHPKPIYIQYQ